MADTAQRRYKFRERMLLAIVPALVNCAIRLIGPTLRLRLSLAPGSPPDPPHHPSIFCLWHRSVLAVAYAYRESKMRVMISRSFDGELISRVAEKLGYVPVRGSSSRGGTGALLQLHDEVAAGMSAVFTADGPRGPKYVAKPGPVLLARNTGVPIVAFHLAMEHAWILRSWDAMIIPKPFSRGVLRVEAPFTVPATAEGQDLQQYIGELQRRLDAARIEAEAIIASRES